MPTRRAAIATGAGLVASATAGCLDLVFGEGLNFEATPPSVAQSALDQTGYEEQEVSDHSVEREFEAAGQTRTVGLTNHHAQYDKSVDLQSLGLPVDSPGQRAAVFSAYTTPQVEVAGQDFNPIDDVSTAELIATVQNRYDGMGGLEQAGEEPATLAGTETTATEFQGDLELQGPNVTVEVTVYVTDAIASGEDFLLAVGAYPTALASVEDDNVFTLMESVQHDG